MPKTRSEPHSQAKKPRARRASDDTGAVIPLPPRSTSQGIEISPEVRLRERGARFLSDSELVGILIGRRNRETASLLAAIELARRLFPRPWREDILKNPERAARSLFVRHARPEQEVFGAIYFGGDGRWAGEAVHFRGTLLACAISIFPILTEALRRDASSVMLFHNHPSGNSAPSGHDLAFTEQAKLKCKAVDRLASHSVRGNGHLWTLSVRRS